ncbi:hypothetical protein F0562_016563 [Nyssa sinensis]|uniref:DUF6821 domain-containing protein n=1 Tax=Nyssa sinensis TaxID=561372 RepID=A0A5J4ZCU6_9ASTE|nr:hypothetical protein F0562_016563 [Nyssa sinensis]
MDLQEWELLPDHEIHDDGGENIFSRKYGTDQKILFKTDYFICPSPNSQKKFVESSSVENSIVPNQLLVAVPTQLESTTGKLSVPVEINMEPSVITENIKVPNIRVPESDQDMVSQIFFKKMKKNEFVDMKMDSPKSGSKGIIPQIDAGTFQFEDKREAMEVEKELVSKTSKLDSEMKQEAKWEEKSGGLNIWKWSSTGIGAICSFGVAAATICIFIMGNSQRNKHHQQNQKLRFQIYTDDKRIKQVVEHATKLNAAMSAVGGVPLTRAHITFGGYYDGL